MTITIEALTKRNLKFIVDFVDKDLLNHKWYSQSGVFTYITRTPRLNNKPQKRVYIHREIMQRILGRELLKGEEVDHKNGNPVDNRRCNLRLASRSQNTCNIVAHKDSSTGVKGIAYDVCNNTWVAKIQINRKRVHLGCFKTKEKAEQARLSAELLYHKEFSILNRV